MAEITRDQFNEDNQVVKKIHQKVVILTDADLNEQIDIDLNYNKRLLSNLLEHTSKRFDEGFKIVGTGSSLSVTCKAGFAGFLVETKSSLLLRIFTDVTISGFNSWTGARTDYVYIEIREIEVNSSVDSNLINPTVGEESAIDIRYEYQFGINEGSLGSVTVGWDVRIELAQVIKSSGSLIEAQDVTVSILDFHQSISVDTSDLLDGAVTEVKIANNAVTSDKIATDAVGPSEIAANAVTDSELADNAVDEDAILNGSVTESKLGTSAVTNTKISSGAVTSAKIGNDEIDSQHYTSGSIDNEHLAANSVDSNQYVNGSIDLVHMSANSVDSNQYVDGSIDNAHLSANSVGLANMTDNSVGSSELVNNSVLSSKIANDNVTAAHINSDVAGDGLSQAAGGELDVTGIRELNSKNLKCKVIDTTWNMDTISDIDVPWGAGISAVTDIVSISVFIFDNTDAGVEPLNMYSNSATEKVNGLFYAVESTNTIYCERMANGTFDEAAYNSATCRIMIWYEA